MKISLVQLTLNPFLPGTAGTQKSKPRFLGTRSFTKNEILIFRNHLICLLEITTQHCSSGLHLLHFYCNVIAIIVFLLQCYCNYCIFFAIFLTKIPKRNFQLLFSETISLACSRLHHNIVRVDRTPNL